VAKPQPSWGLVPYSPEHVAGLVALRRAEWGATEFATAQYIRWQDEANPAGRAVAWLGISDAGQVVAEVWMVPVALQLAGRQVAGCVGANAMVHPEWRRRDVFSTVYARCAEECRRRGIGVSMVVPNRKSLSGLRKRFPIRDLGPVPLMIHPIDLPALGRAWTGAAAVGELAEFAARAARWFGRRRPAPIAEGIEVVKSPGPSFDAEFDAFWRHVSGQRPCMVERTSAYLNWRYSAQSQRRYELFQARRRGVLVGYLVFRACEARGIRGGWIVDMLVESSPVGRSAGVLLGRAAVQSGSSQGCQVISALCVAHGEEYPAYRQAGFLRCPRPLRPHPFRVIAHVHEPSLDGAHLATLDAWCWTFGDYDVF
jgi:GNAT superfamily N-acetyltransferase